MANQLKMALIETILTLHRRRWSQRRIARELNIHRDTVARYIREAASRSKPAKAPIGSEVADGDSKPAKAPLGSEALAREAPTQEAAEGDQPDSAVSRSLCEPWRDIILNKLQAGLTAQRIYQDLVGEHAFSGHYHSVRRFVRRLGTKRDLPFRRMECAPGEEAQIDFGSGIPITGADGKRRRTHVFRIVLSHSRKAYSEAVYRQTTDELIRCLENAFWHFGGVPQTLVFDYVAGHIIRLMFPSALCGRGRSPRDPVRARGENRVHNMETRWMMTSFPERRLSCWSVTTSDQSRSIGSDPRGSERPSRSTSLGLPHGATHLAPFVAASRS